ncbi:MAG: sodium:solute symporter [Kiritimatiellae bacterium]|nr:sodium:solute symporter [Kiritimatiellia bacterium]
MSLFLKSVGFSALFAAVCCQASVRIEWQADGLPQAVAARPVEVIPSELPPGIRKPLVCRQNTDKLKQAYFVFEGDNGGSDGNAAGYEIEVAPGGVAGAWRALPPPVAKSGGRTYHIIGGSVLPMGHQHLLLTARDSDSGALKVVAYHTVTAGWFELGEVPGAPAGELTLLPDGTDGFLVCVAQEGGLTAYSRARMLRAEKFPLLNYVVVAFYFACLLGAAAVMMIRNRRQTANEYFKGDGKLPWWAVGVSIYAAMFSAISMIAGPGISYLLNWSYFTIVISKLLIVPIIACFYLPFFRRLNVTSAYEYLEARFNLACRVFASAAFAGFMIFRAALVVFLPALAVSAIADVPLDATIIGLMVIAAVYCVAGGIKGIVWGDFYQGLILIVAIAVTVVVLISGTDGGWAGFMSIAKENNKFDTFNFTWDLTMPVFWVMIIGGFVSNLNSYTSDQCVLQRFMTTKDEKSAVRSILFCIVVTFISGPLLYAIGTGLFTYFSSHPERLDVTLAKNDAVFPVFIATGLPPGVGGLLLASIFAATLTTLAANLNATATALTTDFYLRFKREKGSDAQAVSCGKALTMASGAVTLILALFFAHAEIHSMQETFYKFLGVLTSGITGLFLLGMFAPRVGGKAAIIGLTVNYVICFTLAFAPLPWKPHLMLYGVAGLISCLVTAPLASLIWPNRKPVAGLVWGGFKVR